MHEFKSKKTVVFTRNAVTTSNITSLVGKTYNTLFVKRQNTNFETIPAVILHIREATCINKIYFLINFKVCNSVPHHKIQIN